MKIAIFPQRGPLRARPRSTGRRSIVRLYFEAYEYKDRVLLDSLLSEDFAFTSPVDDAIGRSEYFARCWPNSRHMAVYQIERLIEDGNDVVVTYTATTTFGASFKNTEIFSFRGDKIEAVQVFFGCETAGGASGAEIADLIETWAEALRRKDEEMAARLFAVDAVGFSLAPPLVCEEDLRASLRDWFDTFEGELGYEIRDLKMHASGDVAWAHALNHLTGTKADGEETDVWFRLTMGFGKMDGTWKILHSHESVPFLMDGSEKAALDLLP